MPRPNGRSAYLWPPAKTRRTDDTDSGGATPTSALLRSQLLVDLAVPVSANRTSMNRRAS